MCESLVRRAWLVGLVLLFTAVAASGQVPMPPFQNTIAWGGPIQPDVGRGDQSQSPVPSNASGQTQDGNSAASSDQTPGDGTADNSANGAANGTVSANPDNTVKQLGTPFPLQLQPEGLKIGPFYIPSITDSFSYAVNSAPGQPTQSFVGNSIAFNLVYSKTLSRGVFAVQAHEQFSLANSWNPYINQSVGVTFNEQLSERWSLNAAAYFTYFQNSLLANPQYILAYNNGGIVQQTLFLQQQGTNIYESNNISLSYQMGTRTVVSFTPILQATYQYLQGGWSNVRQFGGGVTVTHTLTPDLSVSGYYTLSYASTSGTSSTYPSWVNQNIGVGFQGTFVRYRGWSLGGSVAASSQHYAGSYTITPTGTLSLFKSFGQSSITAAYTRTEASTVLVSNGYFDQADVAYNRKFGQKFNLNVGAGLFRTSYSGTYYNGKRVGGSVTYQWTPRVGLNAGYNFAHQNGVQSTNFAPYLGNTNYLSVGLVWALGNHSGL
jgi:hypothetical protein